jgi:AcrR family transcriptional regulator
VEQASYARRRRVPSQPRSRDTFEAVCSAAAAIIAEQGLEALTTNGVARRAGVSITAVYAYFPDKWAIVHELFERFERLRGDYIAERFAGVGAVDDWRAVMVETWDALVRFRIEVPAGMALRQAVHATPRLRQVDLEGTERVVRELAASMITRRPDLDPERARQVAWTATIAAGPILDDACETGTIDEVKLAEGKRLLLGYLAPYLDPLPADGTPAVPPAAGASAVPPAAPAAGQDAGTIDDRDAPAIAGG